MKEDAGVRVAIGRSPAKVVVNLPQHWRLVDVQVGTMVRLSALRRSSRNVIRRRGKWGIGVESGESTVAFRFGFTCTGSFSISL